MRGEDNRNVNPVLFKDRERVMRWLSKHVPSLLQYLHHEPPGPQPAQLSLPQNEHGQLLPPSALHLLTDLSFAILEEAISSVCSENS